MSVSKRLKRQQQKQTGTPKRILKALEGLSTLKDIPELAPVIQETHIAVGQLIEDYDHIARELVLQREVNKRLLGVLLVDINDREAAVREEVLLEWQKLELQHPNR